MLTRYALYVQLSLGHTTEKETSIEKLKRLSVSGEAIAFIRMRFLNYSFQAKSLC